MRTVLNRYDDKPNPNIKPSLHQVRSWDDDEHMKTLEDPTISPGLAF